VLAIVLAGCSSDESPLRLVGTIEQTLYELVAPVSEFVVSIRVERGQHVDAGDILVQLDPTLATADVARAEARLAAAKTASAVAEHELERSSKLKRAGVASSQDYDRARLGRDEVAARLREAEALLAAARKRERDHTLRSPVAGVVDQIPFDRGERVPAGAVLAVVFHDGPPWVRVWLPETSVALVIPGTRAEIRIDGIAAALTGSVLDVAREPEFTPHYALTERERVHLVYETRVRIENAPPWLRPGVPAEVWLFPAPQLRAADP
jgi:HlyD family secretion protein